ncbi:TRAM domain-containing protein [Haladaptatus sp. DFWS20]|uniref:TRAM domain-containing protein n=1 Tax=Haladaptatus sp. DFWS20 TaxID=3403467 RepID=UPI003EB806EA
MGDHRTVEIESIGEQGDGIARVDRGYVIIVPDTENRDRVTVEINDVTPTIAFAEVVKCKVYYECSARSHA